MPKQIKPNLIGIEITPQEARLIHYIRRMKFGSLNIDVKEGLPFRIVKIETSILLTSEMKKDG